MDNPQQLGTIRTTSIVPVDLNSLMFHMEKAIARASKAAGDSAKSAQYDALANARQKALEKYLWNDKEGWYADYDLKSHKVRNQLTAAALFPLYVNAASSERAAKVAAATEARLLKPGGLTTTTVNSGQQWDAPNGWAPLQWVAAEGLQKYGQQTIAMEVSWRFLSNVQHTYNSEQKLVEKYDVSSTGTGGGGGEYPLQDGFGWTNGVTLKMLDLVCPKEKPCDSVPTARPAANDDNGKAADVSAQPAAQQPAAVEEKKSRRKPPRGGGPPRVFINLQFLNRPGRRLPGKLNLRGAPFTWRPAPSAASRYSAAPAVPDAFSPRAQRNHRRPYR